MESTYTSQTITAIIITVIASELAANRSTTIAVIAMTIMMIVYWGDDY